MTPSGSLSGSQRETWTTSGVSQLGAGPRRMMSARRSTRPGEPSSRVNTGTPSAGRPFDQADVHQDGAHDLRRPSPGSSGEKASMLGVMIVDLPWSQYSGT